MTELPSGQVLQEHPADPNTPTAARKTSLSPRFLAPRFLASRFLMGLSIATLASVCLIGISGCKPYGAADAFQDLGAGISHPTGLRGSLKTRWQGNAVQYQLEIKPIDLYESAGVSFVVANPPGPLFLHMKLMDAAGYAVCGKDVLFPFDKTSPGEAARERGQDLLQTTVGDDGKVDSLSAQGILPCTPDQYKQVDYWDFSTNFPTSTEQDALRKHAAELKKRQEAQKQAALERQKAGPSAFYMEGDDRVATYDASSDVLRTHLNRSFLVTAQAQQTMARMWANDGITFRYKCDQRSRCLLTSEGGRQSLSVTALE